MYPLSIYFVCMFWIWARSQTLKNVKICGNTKSMFFFSSFPYSDSPFVTYKAFLISTFKGRFHSMAWSFSLGSIME